MLSSEMLKRAFNYLSVMFSVLSRATTGSPKELAVYLACGSAGSMGSFTWHRVVKVLPRGSCPMEAPVK